MQCVACSIVEVSLDLLVFKEHLLVEDNVSYLTKTTSLSTSINHVVLMASLSEVN
jgi:hypothetical protein